LSIEVSNETNFAIDQVRVLRLAEFALDQMRIHPAAELSIIFVDEKAMEQLHLQWMDEPGATDVLSFPMDELRPGTESEPTPAGLLGDIVICPTVAEKQAVPAGHETINEVLLLTTHGLLHLLGFDHVDPEEELEMFGIQKSILKQYYESESSQLVGE
jgi:probable rRNA maturation factor